MSQQINLYNAALVPKKNLFTALNLFLVSLILLCAVAACFAVLRWRMQNLALQESASSEQLRKAQEQFQVATATLKMPSHDANLDRQLKNLQGSVEKRQQASEILQRGGLGNVDGFSAYMAAMARQIPDGVWLLGLDFESANSVIGIHGRSLEADRVPVFVNQLKREKIMQGKAFAALNIQRPFEDEPDAAAGERKKTLAPFVEFELHTSALSVKSAGGSSNE